MSLFPRIAPHHVQRSSGSGKVKGIVLDTASGDLLADRRADYAAMLGEDGDWGAAAEVLLGALEIAPAWAFGWFRLGEMQEAAGQRAAAAEAWRMAQALDPADHAGAMLKLALAGAAPVPERPPSAFVETLFDQYAGRFDRALVETLGYRVPELLFAAITKAHAAHFRHAVDLGCGTGLMGALLRPVAGTLVGVDISAAMLAEARAKSIYDRLEKADIQHLPFEGEPIDLVTAADVFMYLGRLEETFRGVRAMLADGGLFAFSVERFEGEGLGLRETRRFAHAEGYVCRVLEDAGFSLLSLERAAIRQDRSVPVEGLVVVAQPRHPRRDP